MEVNSTLFIQIINFFIGWALMRQLIFKPTIAAYERKRVAQATQIREKEVWHEHIVEQKQHIASRWHRLKRFYRRHKPDIEHPDFFVFKDVLPSIEPETPEKEQLRDIQHEIADAITAGVKDAKQ